MFDLLLCVLCCSSLLVFFKYFEKFEIDFFQAIVFNYITCALIGAYFTDLSTVDLSLNCPWIYYALVLGSLFISIFYLSSQTTKLLGISTATIAMKLAIVFPVGIGMIIYQEPFAWHKIIGIVLAIVAVILCSLKEEKHHIKKELLIYPLLVWMGSGACDSMVQYIKLKYFPENGFEGFVMIVFAVAALWGLVVLLFTRKAISLKSIVGGIGLGIPNYFSMYFVFRAMISLKKNYLMDSSVFFPINNISVVIVSALIAVFFFEEKLSKLNLIGLLMAFLATVLLFI